MPQVRQRAAGGMTVVPLFPGYFFVAGLPREQAPGAIGCMRGCAVVTQAAAPPAPHTEPGAALPATVAAPVIAWLRGRVAAIDAAGGLPAQILGGDAAGDVGEAGDAVNAADAAAVAVLAAATGGLQPPAARVAALLQLLGCRPDGIAECAPECTPERVPAPGAPAPPKLKRRRRTRGHGRRIHYE